MKHSDFATRLESFLREFLPAQRNASRHTIRNYGYAFLLLLEYFRTICSLPAHRLTLDHLTPESITGFLDWLERVRENGVNARNQRLAAIHSFFRYLQTRHPERLNQCQRILNLKSKRGQRKQVINHLSPKLVSDLMSGPDLKTKRGRRDATLLALLYDTGMRVQELCDLTPKCLRMEPPAHVSVLGKGRKHRIVPLMSDTVELLKTYLVEHDLTGEQHIHSPLFFNQQRKPLTRGGIRYILRKYASRLSLDGIATVVTPHTLRHSKAMHLLQAGNPLVAIQSILGHADIRTTMIYASADLKMMRAALEKAPAVTPESERIPTWTEPDTLVWLQNLCAKE
jgi:integrase/recombinase XerD